MEQIAILNLNKGILKHFPFFKIFSPNLNQLFLSRDTVSFFLKFFLFIWNFLISGNFLKSDIADWRQKELGYKYVDSKENVI